MIFCWKTSLKSVEIFLLPPSLNIARRCFIYSSSQFILELWNMTPQRALLLRRLLVVVNLKSWVAFWLAEHKKVTSKKSPLCKLRVLVKKEYDELGITEDLANAKLALRSLYQALTGMWTYLAQDRTVAELAANVMEMEGGFFE